MDSFKLGLCSVTFRKKSAEEIVEIAKKNRVDFIEWGGDVHVRNIEDARHVKDLCDKANIKISSYGSYYNTAAPDLSKWEEICKISNEMGASSVRIWLGKKNSENFDSDEYIRTVEHLRKLCDTAAEYDLMICPECHDNTFNNKTDAFLKLKKDLQRNNFRTYFQSRYYRMEYDLDRIDRTFDYIENVHVSYRDLKKEQLFRKKDYRYIDKILNKLKSMSFKGIVMIEFVDFANEYALSNDIRKLKK
ncbi:MAG: sugar phosphate isomerase/epimerase [Clostridia bacterium]|nr:sugar phosphate isomerase/epimerase [Clostridia bacterium]